MSKNGYFTDGFYVNDARANLASSSTWPAGNKGYAITESQWFDSAVSEGELKYVTRPSGSTRLYGYNQNGAAELFTGILANKYYDQGELFTGFAAPVSTSSTVGGPSWVENPNAIDGGRYQLLVLGVPYTGMTSTAQMPAAISAARAKVANGNNVPNLGGLPVPSMSMVYWNNISIPWNTEYYTFVYWRNGRAGTGAFGGVQYLNGAVAGRGEYDAIISGKCYRSGALLTGPSYEAPIVTAEGSTGTIHRMFRAGVLYTGVFYGSATASPTSWANFTTTKVNEDTGNSYQISYPEREVAYSAGREVTTVNGFTRPLAFRGSDNVARLYLGIDYGKRFFGVLSGKLYAQGVVSQGYYLLENQGNTFLTDPPSSSGTYAHKVFFNGIPYTGFLSTANAELAGYNTEGAGGIGGGGILTHNAVGDVQYLRGGVCHGVHAGAYYHYGIKDTGANEMRTVYYRNGVLAHNYKDSNNVIYGNGVAGQGWEFPV